MLLIIGKDYLTSQIKREIYIDYAENVIVRINRYSHILIEDNGIKYRSYCLDVLCKDYLNNRILEGTNIKLVIIRHTDNPTGIIVGGKFYDKEYKINIIVSDDYNRVKKSLRNDCIMMMVLRALLIYSILKLIFDFIIFFREKY